MTTALDRHVSANLKDGETPAKAHARLGASDAVYRKLYDQAQQGTVAKSAKHDVVGATSKALSAYVEGKRKPGERVGDCHARLAAEGDEGHAALYNAVRSLQSRAG